MMLLREKQVSPVEPVATPMPFSNMEQQFTQSSSNKVQRQRVNQVQQRRKWSEWSECSINCVRTRHRLNCDDILAQNATLLHQQQAASGANSKPTTPIKSVSASATLAPNSQLSPAKRKAANGDKLETTNEDEDELLLKADQYEDEDYADEGDEEDDQDSCANVDSSKTSEEVPCYVGQCRLTMPPPPLAGADQLASASVTMRPGPLRERAGSSGQHQSRARNQISATQRVLSPAIRGQELNHHQAGGQQQQLADSGRLISDAQRYDYYQPAYRQPPQRHPVRSHRNGTTSQHEQASISAAERDTLSSTINDNNNATGEELNNGTSAIPTPTTTTTSTNAIWTTRNMWPQQLLNSDLGPQANLIQWTILIGSLLTIILLIMLILRKLFVSTMPSYHWMLAKQTIKSASGHQLGANHGGSSSSAGSGISAANCCRSARRQQNCRSAAVAAATGSCLNLGNSLVLDSRMQLPTMPPPHMCYVWHNGDSNSESQHSLERRACKSARGSVPGFHQHHLKQQQQQLVVDASGRHLLTSSSLTSAKFNTDNLFPFNSECLHANPVSMDAKGLTNSSSSSQGNNLKNLQQVPNLHEHQHQQQQLQGHQDFDALSIISHNYNYDTLNSSYGKLEGDNKAFAVSPHQAQKDTSNNSNETPHSLLHDENVNTEATTDLVPSSKNQVVKDDDICDHRKGKTATSGCNGTSKSNRGNNSTGSSSSSNSRASPISVESSSPSIQSTTAQMLSNAASSSFEQPNELGEHCPSTPNSVAGGSSTALLLQSANASPANSRKLTATKLTCLPLQSVQSQPNSPMFANQFSAINNGRIVSGRFKATPKSFRAPKLASNREVTRASSRDNTGSRRVSKQGHARKPSIQATELAATIRQAQQSHLTQAPHASTRLADCDNDDRHYYEEISHHQQHYG